MKKFKKLTAVLLSVVMIVCMFSVPTSAKGLFDNAIKMTALETYSKTFTKTKVEDIYYKIVLTDSGILHIRYGSHSTYGWPVLYNSNAEIIKETIGDKCDIEIAKKGTYYLKVSGRNMGYDDYINDLYYSFTPDHTPTISLGLNVKVGDELSFSALATNYTGGARWGTTNAKVATVSKGKVEVVGAGKAKIRVYMDNGEYAEITLIAKKK